MFKVFINAIFAGVFIGIAGTVYLATPNAMFGAVLFGLGLLTIVCFGFKLYTGAVGYLVNHGKDFGSYLGSLLVIWCGNWIGTFAVGLAVRHSRSYSLISQRVATMAQAKIADSCLSLLILSFFCGILMYLAVETFRRDDLPGIFRYFGVVLPVAVFILCGFEHCIADMYYFSAAGVWSGKVLALTGLLTLGNSLGGMLIPLGDKIRL